MHTFLIGLMALSLPVAQQGSAVPPTAEELLEDISLLNLLRGLNLTRRQQEGLLDLARRASEIRAEVEAERKRGHRQWATELADLRRALLACEHPPTTEVEERAAAGEIHDIEANQAITDQLRPLAEELTALLPSAQQEVVRTFQPCLIPPSSLRDPVRVGQPSSDLPELDGALHDMETLRALPDSAFELLVEPTVRHRLPEWSPLEGGG